MNSRQAAKAAAKHIEELEHIISLNSRDIKLYNETILSMINHGSPCEYCNDADECREAGKDLSIGCEDWQLSFHREPQLAQWQKDVQEGKETGLFAAGGMD